MMNQFSPSLKATIKFKIQINTEETNFIFLLKNYNKTNTKRTYLRYELFSDFVLTFLEP